jgi:tetratricopeptide (TPR) repeat protein
MSENSLPLSRAAALSQLARDEDPLYMPAAFVLGYIHLRRGEAENARQAFDPLIQPFKREREHAVALLRSRFVQPASMFLILVKPSKVIRRWEGYFAQQITYLHGGRFYMAAAAWERIKQERAEEEAGRKSEFRTAHIKALAENLSQLWDPIPAMQAAGLGSADRDQMLRAQAGLDTFLQPWDLSRFNTELTILHAVPALIKVQFPGPFETQAERAAREQQIEADKARFIGQVDGLEAIPIGRLFSSKLQRLKQLIRDEKWDEFEKQVESIEQETRDPDDGKFAELLQDARVDSFQGRIVSFFLPAFAEVRKARAYLRQLSWPTLSDRVRLPLYTEASYYSLQALLLTFEPKQMIEAAEQAERFRNIYPSRFFKTSEVYLLIISLEAEAILRAHIQQNDDDTSFRAAVITPHREILRKALKSHRVKSGTRASACLALGLFQRVQRKGEEAARHRSALEDKSKDETARYEEVELYMESIDLFPSASAHCYIAECRREEGRDNEARAHIKQALAMSPEHALAKKLAAQTNFPPDENGAGDKGT